MEIISREYVIEHLVKNNNVMSYEDLLTIEKNLGYELTASQICYIITGEMRYTGLSTAQAIRDYLFARNSGNPLVYHPSSPRAAAEARYKINIIQELEGRGMPAIRICIR
jgi:hypothetical protein